MFSGWFWKLMIEKIVNDRENHQSTKNQQMYPKGKLLVMA